VGAFSRFNLSDVFEYMSPGEIESLLTELLRVSRPDSRVAFWTLFIPREVPRNRRHQISGDESLQNRLRSIDRGFFYGSFCLWQLKPVRAEKRLARECLTANERRTAHA
jgi:S-adenosylmethionine-diacylglycerol 3-amino-3-carboxypropyl transferase